jgi:hypothetical protein
VTSTRVIRSPCSSPAWSAGSRARSSIKRTVCRRTRVVRGVVRAGPVRVRLHDGGQGGHGAGPSSGAMRISDEIDALEVMGISGMTFLCATRLLACCRSCI